MNATHDVTRKALGRFAYLGSLYDIVSDQLVSGSILSEMLPADSNAITRDDTSNTHYTFDHENTYSSTLHKLDVEGELKVNILTGILDIQATNKFLRTVNHSHNVVRSTMIYRLETCLQTLHLSHMDLKSRITEHSFQSLSATHVVTRIQWGAYVLTAFNTHVDKDSKQHEVQGKLKAAVEKLGPLALGGAGVEAGHTNDAQSSLDGVSIEVSGDIQLKTLPTTVDEVRAVIASIPESIKTINDGKGKQLEFTLTPIQEVARQLNISYDFQKLNRYIRQLSNSIVRSIEHEYDEFLREAHKVDQLIDYVQNYREHLRHGAYQEVMRQRELLDNNTDQFREELTNLLNIYRTQALEEMEAKNNIRKQLEKQRERTTQNLTMFSQINQSIQVKINIVQQLQKENVRCLERDESWQPLLYSPKDIFLLRLSGIWFNDKNATFRKVFHQFLDLVHHYQNQFEYVMLDLDLMADNNMATTATASSIIEHYKDGMVVPTDEDYTLYHNLQIEQRMAECQQSSNVNLDREGLTDRDIEVVVETLIVNKGCTEISLNSNKITPRGASILAEELHKNNTLIVLKLDGNQLSDKGVLAVARALTAANKTLETLHLGSNGITDDGASHLGDMLKTNTTLTNLTLSTSKIGDRGARRLAHVLESYNTNLKELCLSGNKSVTDSSVDSLTQMIKRTRSLNTLDITHCNLSEKGKEQLRKVARTKQGFALMV